MKVPTIILLAISFLFAEIFMRSIGDNEYEFRYFVVECLSFLVLKNIFDNKE